MAFDEADRIIRVFLHDIFGFLPEREIHDLSSAARLCTYIPLP